MTAVLEKLPLDKPLPAARPHRLPGLDGLRAISILLVIGSHFARDALLVPDGWVKSVLWHGAYGVDVFFVISGFLITWLLLEEEAKSGVISLSRFYLRRVFRILPAALTYLVVVAVARAIGKSDAPPRDIISAALFWRNYSNGASVDTGHYWSLSIEEQFYLLWPVSFYLLKKRSRMLLVLGVVLVAPLWRQLQMKMLGAANVNWWRFDLRLDPIAMGCLLALVRSDPASRRWLQPRRSMGTGCAFLAIAVTVFAQSSITEHLPGYLRFLATSVSSMGVALLINVLIEGRSNLINGLFNSMPLVWIGVLSYSLYLWQQAFCFPGAMFDSHAVGTALLMTAAAATASYVAIEQPSLRARRFVEHRLSAGRAALSPARTVLIPTTIKA